jgi:hypothetical protein
MRDGVRYFTDFSLSGFKALAAAFDVLTVVIHVGRRMSWRVLAAWRVAARGNNGRFRPRFIQHSRRSPLSDVE